MSNNRGHVKLEPKVLAVLFLGITLTIVLCGYGYYRAESKRIVHDKHLEIAAIARMKVDQVHEWRKERLDDAIRAAGNPFFRRAVEDWFRSGWTSGKVDVLRERLKMEHTGGFDDALLLSPEGTIRLSASQKPDPVAPAVKRAIAEVKAGSAATLSDFYRCPRGRVHLDAVAAVRSRDGKLTAVLIQRNDASAYLFPLIRDWPIPSASAESLLVRRDGDHVLFLNKLRHRAGESLTLRLPLSQRDLPATRAVLGGKGLFLGKDYRGVAVLSDLTPIPDSPWHLVAKVDADEILAEARYRAGIVSVMAIILILLTALILGYIYRRRQAVLYLDLYRSEKEQREAREEFRTTLYSIGDAVITTDAKGLVRRMNRVAEHLTGWEEAEAEGKPLDEVFRIVNEETRANVESPVERVLRDGQVVGLANHTALVARDGTECPIDDSAAPILDPEGRVVGVVLVFHDVTERKKATLALKESARFLGTLLDAIPAPVFYKDMEGRYLGFNKSFEEFFGVAQEELVGKNVFDILPLESAEIFHQKDIELLGDPGTQVYEANLKDARGVGHNVVFHKATFTGAEGEIRGIIGVILDISELKRTQDTLRESETRVRSKLNAILSPEGSISELELSDILDVDAVQALMNDFYALTKMGIGIIDRHGKVLVGTGWQEVCTNFHRSHPETFRYCVESDTELSAGVEPGAFKLYRCKNNMWDMSTPITLAGKHMGNIFLGQFIFADEVPDYAVFRAQAEKYGFNEQEYLAALDRVPRWTRERVQETMAFYAIFAKMISESSYANIKLARALAEREKIEAQLIQAQKMEAVGRLAGGIAHDFNNLLNVILGYADLALMKINPSNQVQIYLQEVKKAAERSADLTRQLLAFARQQTIAPKVLDLNETVERMLKMLTRLIGEEIVLEWAPAAGIPHVNMDPAQIDQILANLVVNARDAISGVGRITIETGEAVFDKEDCQTRPGFLPGEYVLLAVSDDGCGIEEKNLSLLFEPFFTTKEVGKGTGLGLATVYGIVKQNNGFINVYSEPEKGSTFRIYLPVHSAGTKGRVDLPECMEKPRGDETVLLVEDEASLLTLTASMLEELGYKVLQAESPNRALQLAGEHKGDIHLLLTDVVMPEMNGRALRKLIDSLRPGIRCLFMSGYTANAIAHHGVLDSGVQFMQKPFSIHLLARKVREVLSLNAS